MKKLQVFVSSTYLDMSEERQAAVEAVLRSGHIPAGMELFAAGSESQLDTIKTWIDDSDIFLLILGGRYGTVETQSGKSYIQLEYEYAAGKGKPLFAAVIDSDYLESKVTAGAGTKIIETKNGFLMDAFKATVTSKTCRFFKNTDQLKLIVMESLNAFAGRDDLAGWVRGSEVVDPKYVLDQLERLQSENIRLQEQILKLSDTVNAAGIVSEEEAIVATMTDDAKELLREAAKGDGNIIYVRGMNQSDIHAGNKTFTHPHSQRLEMRWKAAIDLLDAHRLIEDVGHKREIYQVTHLGYQVVGVLQGPEQAGVVQGL